MFDLPKNQRPLTEANEQELAKIAQKWVRQLQNSPLVTIIKTYEDFQKKTADSLNRMFEPLKLTTDRFTKFPSVGLTAGPVKGYQEILLEEQNLLLERLISLKKKALNTKSRSYHYSFETKTLLVKKTDWGAINFIAKSGNTDMALLIEVLYQYLEARGQIKGDYKEVFVTIDEVKQSLASKGKTDVDMSWIKSTRSNIVNHKIPLAMKDILQISEFDKKRGGYYFRIKITLQTPSIN